MIVTVALLAYSYAFSAPFCVPKLIVLGIGLIEMSVRVLRTGEVNSGLIFPAFLLLAVALFSTAPSPDPLLSILGRYNSYALGLMGMSIVLMYYLAGDCSGIELAGPLIGLHAFYQWAMDLSPIVGRAVGLMGSPVDLGIVLAILAPIQKSWPGLLAIGLGLLATGSRGAVLAAAAGLLAKRVYHL